MVSGTDIELITKTETGKDELGNPIYTEKKETIHNVLIGQPTTDDITQTIELYGKKIDYVLGIPKGDTHTWHDVEVEFFGERFYSVGYPMTGIQENIPLQWGQNVRVTRNG